MRGGGEDGGGGGGLDWLLTPNQPKQLYLGEREREKEGLVVRRQMMAVFFFFFWLLLLSGEGFLQ